MCVENKTDDAVDRTSANDVADAKRCRDQGTVGERSLPGDGPCVDAHTDNLRTSNSGRPLSFDAGSVDAFAACAVALPIVEHSDVGTWSAGCNSSSATSRYLPFDFTLDSRLKNVCYLFSPILMKLSLWSNCKIIINLAPCTSFRLTENQTFRDNTKLVNIIIHFALNLFLNYYYQ